MRKLFTLAALFLGLAASFTSCQQDVLDVDVNGEQTVMLNVTIPEAETRATNSAQGLFNNDVLGTEEDANTIRYILQIFDQTGRPSDETLYEYSDGTHVTFPVRLVPGRHYTFVVWADFVTNGATNTDNHYITKDDNGKTDLRNIRINEASWKAMDETRDAFTGIFSTEAAGEKYSGASTIDVELTRPFAKVRVVTTDLVALTNLGIKPDYATVEYTTPYRAGFNALTCQPFEAEQNDKKTHQVSDSEAFAIVAYGDNTAANKVLFTDYLFASADQNDVVKFDLSVYEKADKSGPIKSNSFSTDIAIKRNHLTTISGNILTEGGTVNVVIDPTFGGYIDEEYPFDNTIDPNKAIYYTATKKIERSSWNIDTFGANIVSNTWNESTGEGVIVFDGEVAKIGSVAFSAVPIRSITIPKGVKSIGSMAFNLASLESISFEKGCVLERIDDGAFNYCNNLTSIDLPDVLSMGECVFGGCKELTRITCGGNYYTNMQVLLLEWNGGSATGLHKVFACPSGYVADKLQCGGLFTKIMWGAFTYGNIKYIDIWIKEIDQYNFIYDDVLEGINLDKTTTIANNVLYDCSKLKEVSLPVVETIGKYSLSYNDSLKSIDFSSKNLTEINAIAYNNASLETIYIGSSVSTIKDSFTSCPKLANIYVKATAVPVLSGSFDAIPTDAKIYVPRESVDAYKSAAGWSDYASAIEPYDFNN